MQINRPNTINAPFLNKILPFVCGFLLTTILFFPAISIGEGAPAIEIVDFLLPILTIIVFLKRKEIEQKKLMLFILGFGAYIFFTIIMNSRLGSISDHFEIYKIIKFVILICIFSFINPATFYKNWITPLFIGLVVFNLIHYFNIFHFNVFLEQVYFGNNNYIEFGINSAGLPNSKRMMGFTANPNNNAVIFGLFAIIFLPKKEINYKSVLLFSLAVLMLFLCQSRTAMLAFPCLLVVYAFLSGKQWKKTATIFIVSFLVVGLSLLISTYSIGVGTPPDMIRITKFISEHPGYIYDEKTEQILGPEQITKKDTSTIVQENSSVPEKVEFTYLESVAHGQFLEGSSMTGRYEIWKHLWKMIKQKPLFGYGPNKEYFYKNVLYAENEFIFMAWKYGFVGLTFYLIIFTILFILAYRNRHLASGANLLLVIVLYSVISMTNLPFAAITLNMLLAVMIGIFFAELRTEKKSKNISAS